MLRSNRFIANVTFRRKAVAGWSVGALLVALCVLPACNINVDKGDNKEGKKHVDIQSPIGDLHVSDQADIRDAGLSVYPGATPAPKEDSSNEKSANVNLALPGFQLKVVAAEFLSVDAPEKVIAYYDKELQKYGKPIQCQGSYSSSAHVDNHGKNDLDKPVTCDKTGRGDGLELKVGTEGNQHIVAVKSKDKGTRFALVYVRMHTGKDTTI